ncbi:MAG: [protein-PII] uridylyltransferase [Alphaproteobacteria bacterium]|nr:[protein-PII] uridylyltransferase [Alphaproteobacteria bacterium]
MKNKRDALLKKLRKHDLTGPEFCKKYSASMDRHVKKLAKEKLPEDIALIATGGYGREELCPYSDIDIVFLVPKKVTKKLEASIEKLLYEFWDSGIKMGHAVRTPQECIQIMYKDAKVLTSLMDARLIWGDKALYAEFTEAMENNRKRRKISDFVKAKLFERDQRHLRFGDTRYVLEPNIKDGKGGLRDYQTLFWITGMAYEAKSPEELYDLKIISKREANRFKKAHDFLISVRCHLHDIAERGEERLHFDIQLELAERLGYTHRNNAKAVERFMKHYFLVTRDIGDMTRIVCAAIEQDEIHKQKWIKPSAQSFMGFEILNNRLNFSQAQNIKKQPSEIMRFFRASQETPYDIHPQAIRTIARRIDLIDQKFRHNPLTNSLFLEILTSQNNASLTLRRMNEAGVLERFIIEFRRVIALMQFDRYHVFTVDEHILRAIDLLHQLESGALRDEAALSSALIHTVENRRALFVAILLHDICKGQNGDHSELGADLALSLCPRLGLDDQETRLVSWLVFDHLFMADIAFKRDLEDPKTLEDFLFRVHGLERLKLLTILTTVDIMAVGPGRWTSWKDKLIQELYYMAEARMTGKHPLVSTTLLSSAIPYDLEPDETRIDIAQDSEKHTTIISVYTQDQKGLFAKLTGALSLSGVNIIEARINTLDDGRVADIFTVQNLGGKPIVQKNRKEKIEAAIRDTIDNNPDLTKQIKDLTRKKSKKDQAFEIPKGVTIKNKASRRFNVVETFGRDKPGLLYELCKTINKHNCIIKSAKINTLGLKAVDVFYIQDSDGKKIKDKAQLEKLEKSLLNLLQT